MNSWNLGLRFLLEMAAIAGFASLAWSMTSGLWRYGAIAGGVMIVVVLWTVFNVPDDPSRSGAAPVAIPGLVRLILELAILLGGALAFHLAGRSEVGMALAGLIAIHYALSWDRIAWLLER